MLAAVTATSPDNAWAVGSSSLGAGGTAVIERWDGTAWTWPASFCGSPSTPRLLPAQHSPSAPIADGTNCGPSLMDGG
jgi:hypothetical protein